MSINFAVDFQENNSVFTAEFSTSDKTFESKMVEVQEVVTSDHRKLVNRDAENQHPISAITNLEAELDGKITSKEHQPMSNMEIENLINSFV